MKVLSKGSEEHVSFSVKMCLERSTFANNLHVEIYLQEISDRVKKTWEIKILVSRAFNILYDSIFEEKENVKP